MVRHYNLDEVLLMIAGVPITEYADGDVISFDFPADDWLTSTGSHGSVMRSKNTENNIIEGTITLMQGSPVNETLSQMAATDLLTGLGAGAFMLKDLNGTTLLAAEACWIKKRAPIKMGKEAGSAEWAITVALPEYNMGQNRLV